MTRTTTVNLPFEGFYYSLYSDAIDQEEHREIENNTDRQEEEKIPEELRLTEDEYANILWRHTSYDIAYRKTAEAYVDAFNIVASDALDLPLRLTFESLDSPREYNFATDRVYATVPLAVLYLLFRRSRAENHATLKAVVEERFTSRSGFISFYDNTLDAWLAKPLADWDHNELGTLLIAALRMAGSDGSDFGLEVYYKTTDCDGLYHEWEAAVDWPAVDAAVAELRAEKALQPA